MCNDRLTFGSSENHKIEASVSAGSSAKRVLWIIISNIGKDKSFVDDLNMEQSIVSVRVGLSYDPLRLSSCSLDLFFYRTFLPPITISLFLVTGRRLVIKNVLPLMQHERFTSSFTISEERCHNQLYIRYWLNKYKINTIFHSSTHIISTYSFYSIHI